MLYLMKKNHVFFCNQHCTCWLSSTSSGMILALFRFHVWGQLAVIGLRHGRGQHLLYPRLQRSWKGYTGFTLSVCPSVRPSVCPSVDRIVSTLYLQQYSSDPFHICTSYQATSEGVSHVMFVSKLKSLKFSWILKICKFDFVFFWLGIQYD